MRKIDARSVLSCVYYKKKKFELLDPEVFFFRYRSCTAVVLIVVLHNFLNIYL